MSARADLIRSGTWVALTGIAAAGLQPIITRPMVAEVSERAFMAFVLSGGAAGLVLMVARVWHQLATWHLSRPPAVMVAGDHAATWAADREAVYLQGQEATTPADDDARRHILRVIQFCVIASGRGSFGWRDMAPHTDRPSWDWLTGHLIKAGVVTPGRGRRPHQYAAGWDSPRVRVMLRRSELTIPAPDFPLYVHW